MEKNFGIQKPTGKVIKDSFPMANEENRKKKESTQYIKRISESILRYKNLVKTLWRKVSKR